MQLIARRRLVGRRAALILLLAGLLALTILLLLPRSAAAQDEGQPPDQTASSAESTTAAAQPRLLTHIIRSAGVFFGPLLLFVSIGLVALIVLLAMDLRMVMAIPPTFVEQFTDTVNKRRFREAYDLAKGDPSYLAKVLTAGMSRLQYGIEDARDTAYHTVDSVKASKEQLITYLATIGSLGPMLGLVGTVYGMILSFMELSQPGKTPNPQKLADGISHALVITLLGIAVAVPAIFFHAFFRNRLIRLSMDTANVADDLLTQIYHNSKKSGGGATSEIRAPAVAGRPVEEKA
jgi:biopolymer transport protein ExbB